MTALIESFKYFPYTAPRGGHPKEQEEGIYLKRKDPLTKKVKVVPEVMIPITHGRKPIPTHQLLEDDWRAFRSIAKFQARLATLPSQPRSTRSYPVYDSRLPPVGGYVYANYKACKKSMESMQRPPVRRPIPLTVFEGPFQSVLSVHDCAKAQRLLERDRTRRFNTSAPIVLRTYEADNAYQLALLNEPDVITQESLGYCFDQGLLVGAMNHSRHLRPFVEKLRKKRAH